MTDFKLILNAAKGSLSEVACQVLYELAQQVPEDGIIFDLYSGEGRSTIAMALGLEHAGAILTGVRIVSMDTHVTNPTSTTPYADGTILKFLDTLRRFRVIHRVSTMIGTEDMLTVFNKRSANLVVLQSPSCPVAMEDVLETSIRHAQSIIRKNGPIVVVRPPDIGDAEFTRFVSARFGGGFIKVVSKDPALLIYRSV